MNEPIQVNPQLIGTVDYARKSTMTPDSIAAEGAGKAYQSVAHSMALAVQDATDNLRNVSTVATTGMGVALAQVLATGDPDGTYTKALQAAQQMASVASQTFLTIGTDAAAVLKSFPTGGSTTGN